MRKPEKTEKREKKEGARQKEAREEGRRGHLAWALNGECGVLGYGWAVG